MNVEKYFKKYRGVEMPRGDHNRGQLKHVLTGRVFGRLRVIGFYGRKSGEPHWRCYCDPELGGCSNYSVVSAHNLMRPTPPHGRSCGCLREQMMRKRQKAALELLKLAETAN
jgi:hypothetical protein